MDRRAAGQKVNLTVKFFACLVSICLGVLAGCLNRKPESSSPEIGLSLLRRDVLVEKHFYAERTLTLPANPDEVSDGPSHFVTKWKSASITTRPIKVIELSGAHGKTLGISVEVVAAQAIVDGYSGKSRDETALLDIGEVEDLIRALEYEAKSVDLWKSNRPDHSEQISFESKDSLECYVTSRDSGLSISVSAGTSDPAVVYLDKAQADSFRSNLENAVLQLRK